MTILLTSAGTDIKDEILKILPKPARELNLVHIMTATKTETNLGYVEKDRKNLEEMGFTINDYDIEDKTTDELERELQKYDIIFMQGGNTFYLLKIVKKTGFDKIIKEQINKGKIYIGVSAGSMICGPSIETGTWKNADKNKIGLKDISALNLIPFNLFVHYDPKWHDIVAENLPKAKYPVRILTNQQGFLVKDDIITLVGQKPEIKI